VGAPPDDHPQLAAAGPAGRRAGARLLLLVGLGRVPLVLQQGDALLQRLEGLVPVQPVEVDFQLRWSR
jgi:hypothetical protein